MKKNSLIFLISTLLLISVGLNLKHYLFNDSLLNRIKAAESLFNLNFTNAERDSLSDGVSEAITKYQAIHSFDFPNNLPPALAFSPFPVNYQPNFASKASNFSIPKQVNVPENKEELCFFTVAELAYLIKNRIITSEELTTLYINRLKRYNNDLFCVITMLEDRALSQAKAMDIELKNGKYRGPLHGIPYGVKDLLALKGYPFTYGSSIFKDQIASITSPVITKLDEAGAVLIAKLSLGELAWGDVWYGEKTRNPWNTDTGSSGSSAGSASATAAGLVAFAIGSETWGSIVSPSTVCGVTGLRPTYGRVSRTGAMALSWSMDKIGPLCRTAQDAAIVLNAISGIDGIDNTLVDMPNDIDLTRSIKSLRVGFTEDYFSRNYGFKHNDSLVLENLKGMGVDLNPIQLPEDLPISALSIILDVEASAAFSELTLKDLDDQMVRQGKVAWPNFFRKARFIPAVEYIQANRIRTKLIEEFSNLFEQVDVIISPSFGGNQLLMTNLTGHPAISVPTGFSERGLPTSITFIGNWFKEEDILLLAKAYQDQTQWYRKTPQTFTP
jgi:Asp-tRNA(Asn)/Glu-tRNA(Gln) amidotransferase A subunit family amidase